jgi:hypothetical protein
VDVPVGKQWITQLYQELKNTNFGIICLTPENREAPWILFEAGALAKLSDKATVVPYLFQLRSNDVKEPLGAFQGVSTDEDDTRKVLAAINAALGRERLSDEDFNEVFNKWWPDLKADLNSIAAETTELPPKRELWDIADETLRLVRNIEGSPIVSGQVPMQTFAQPDLGPQRQSIRLGELGDPNKLTEYLRQHGEQLMSLSDTGAFVLLLKEHLKPEAARPPEKGLEKEQGSGQAEAGKGIKKVARRAHVPRKRR